MILCGDACSMLQTLDAEMVHACVTSPPYFGLRDYGVSGQIGLESTPEEYITALVRVFDEVKRVLRDDGTLWVNIGDSYAGGGRGGHKSQFLSSGWMPNYPLSPKTLPSKNLIGIPWMLAFALRDAGWYLRQDIIWAKPNPMPESVTDRCTKSHEHILLLSKSPKYYFDADAIAEPASRRTVWRPAQKTGRVEVKAPRYGGNKYTRDPDVFSRTKSGNAYNYRSTRNKRDVWMICTEKHSEMHFAIMPKELVRPCVLAGAPLDGIVLDPFAGSGTTGLVAHEEGRDFVGIELNPGYAKMAEKRSGHKQTKLFG